MTAQCTHTHTHMVHSLLTGYIECNCVYTEA